MKNKFFLILMLFFLLLILSFLYKKETIKSVVKPIPSQKYSGIQKPEIESITLISTGDIGLVRDVDYRIRQRRDVNYPFLKIADYLKDADLTVTNLEGPLIKNCPVILTGFTFCGESKNAKGLSFAGIDAASIANNHTTNYGLEGLRETSDVLKNEGIIAYGLVEQIQYTEIKGKKIALVGFVELGNNWTGLNNATQENVSRLVSLADKNADIVIASFHWGAEYTYKPGQEQISLAHTAIDNGADIILGNHPHWIQINETYKDKFITYAQGNTIFDQDWSQETKEGVIYKFMYKNGRFDKIDEKYTIIEDNSQPRFANDAEVSRIKFCLSRGCTK